MEVERSKCGDQHTRKLVCQLPYDIAVADTGVSGTLSGPRRVCDDGKNKSAKYVGHCPV